jgi:histidine triad (HIT) family protein
VKPDCLFCRIIARELPSKIVYEDASVLAFDDIAPQAPTHVLIIPKTHFATVNDVTDADAGVFTALTLRARAIAQERGIATDGYRLLFNCNAAGGQTVFHLHLHLLGGRQLKGFG